MNDVQLKDGKNKFSNLIDPTCSIVKQTSKTFQTNETRRIVKLTKRETHETWTVTLKDNSSFCAIDTDEIRNRIFRDPYLGSVNQKCEFSGTCSFSWVSVFFAKIKSKPLIVLALFLVDSGPSAAARRFSGSASFSGLIFLTFPYPVTIKNLRHVQCRWTLRDVQPFNQGHSFR